MALIEREPAKAKKVYCEERHEYVVPVAELDWLPTIDPIRAAGGCRCGECKHHGAVDGPMRQCDITDDNDFCSYGEPRVMMAMAECIYRTYDGHCIKHSDDVVKEWCLEGPCIDERLPEPPKEAAHD